MARGSALFSIILADDEASILEGLKTAVDWNELGIYIAGTAMDGTEALQAVLELEPDFAVMDVRMPGLSGLEVIRRAADAGIRTRFIILSGYDDFAYAKDAIRYGAKAYLLKPIDATELFDELQRLCIEADREGQSGSHERFRQELSRSFLKRLIDGRIAEPALIARQLEGTGLSLTDSPSYVCILLFEDTDVPKDAAARLNAAFPDEKYVFCDYSAHQVVGIFNASSRLPLQTALECRKLFLSGDAAAPLVGTGDTVPGLMQSPYSYSRAMTALSYRLYINTSGVFTSEIICSVPPTLRLTDIDYAPLADAIVQQKSDEIRAYVEDFIRQILYVPMPPPNYIFSMCYTLYHQIEIKFASFSHREITTAASPQDLYRFKTLPEIQNWLTEYFCRLSEFIDAVYSYPSPSHTVPEPDESEDEIISAAKEYVRAHIADRLRIEDIAGHVNLSPSYFAAYFKGKTGTNLRDYLLAEKMEYARRMLINTDTPVGNIAYVVGYGDYRSFSRAFKNIHGVTPSDFQARFRKAGGKK